MEMKGWWNPKETHYFLNIIKNDKILLKLNQVSKSEKSTVYESIHAKMVKSGYRRTLYQIKNKWKTLKVHYKKDKEKLKNSVGSKIWFPILEDLLKTNSFEEKKVDVERLASRSEPTIANTNGCKSISSENGAIFPSTSFSPELDFARIFSRKNESYEIHSPRNSAKNSHSDASWWRDPETKCFLEIFRKEKALEHIKNGIVKSQYIYNVMHEKMVKAGFTRTADQLKNKWKTLKSIYIKNKEQLRTSGSSTWLPILDYLISPKPIDQTVSCDSAINFTEQQLVKEEPIEVISIDTDSDSVNELITESNTICSTENDSNLSSGLSLKIKSCFSLSQTKKMPKSSACGSWWNDNETYYYLNIIKKENAKNLTNSKTGTMTLSLPVFKFIHAKMVNAGSRRTLQQIINKWRSLNSIYKRKNEFLINSDRIWFPILEELLTKKISNPNEEINECETSQQCEEIVLVSDESNASCDLNYDTVSPSSPAVNFEILSNKFNSHIPTSPIKNAYQGSWWSREETTCYLNILKKENLIKSMSDKNQKRIDSFIVIHEKMMEAGFNRSLEQIRNRWKSLKILYTNDKKQTKPKVDSEWNKILDEMFNNAIPDKLPENLVENGTIPSPQQREEKMALHSSTTSVSSEPGLSRIVSSTNKNYSTTGTSQIQDNSKRIDDSGNNYMEQQMKFMKEMIKEEHKFIEKMIKQHKMDTAEMISTISNNMMSTMEKLIHSKPTINLSLGQLLPTLMNSAASTSDSQDKSCNNSD